VSHDCRRDKADDLESALDAVREAADGISPAIEAAFKTFTDAVVKIGE
jgi:hypothetical protein